MPIRFRCRYCNQLMGIARRKAGMPVNCPTCHAQVIVPHEGEAQPAAPPTAPPVVPTAPTAAPLFERSDFEAFLEDPVHEAPPPRAPQPPAPQPAAPAPSPYVSESFVPSPISLPSAMRSPPVGLVLSPTQATWLTVVAILLLALAFGAGLLVGHYWMG